MSRKLMQMSSVQRVDQLTMRAILRLWCRTIGWPPFAVLVGDIVSRARRHEVPMPMDARCHEKGGNCRGGDIFE